MLSDFDQTFLDSKTKAEEALRTVDDIDEMVRIAYAKTQEAVTAMQVKSCDKQVNYWVHYTLILLSCNNQSCNCNLREQILRQILL